MCVLATLGIFRLPVILGCISGIGLVAALLCDGAIDMFWSAAAAAPLFAIGKALSERSR